ncbi:MAG: DUF5317 domain-containing protein [Candidatus Limnocylindrales bacterium]
MIILVAIPIGILIGLLARGSIANLSGFRFRWSWVAVAGLAIQVALFTPTGDLIAGSAGPAIYVASTTAVFLAVLRNIRLPGMAIIALGSISNLAAIVANGGSMPADAGALATAGFTDAGSHTNSVVLEHPNLQPLTDIFAVPAGIPMANVFSVGDVLIAIGIVVLIATVMRRPVSPAPGAAEPVAPAA